MADEGSLCEMLRKTKEGELALWLQDFLYDNSFKTKDRDKLIEIHDYLFAVAHNELKKKVPQWVRELNKKTPILFED